MAELDSLFFAMNLPSANVSAVTYGTPRKLSHIHCPPPSYSPPLLVGVGNPAFASLIDQYVGYRAHV